MITSKPKNFSILYESGVYGEFNDPRTGIPFYRLNWPALKVTLRYLAETANESVTLINDSNGNTLTVTPEGSWK